MVGRFARECCENLKYSGGTEEEKEVLEIHLYAKGCICQY